MKRFLKDYWLLLLVLLLIVLLIIYFFPRPLGKLLPADKPIIIQTNDIVWSGTPPQMDWNSKEYQADVGSDVMAKLQELFSKHHYHPSPFSSLSYGGDVSAYSLCWMEDTIIIRTDGVVQIDNECYGLDLVGDDNTRAFFQEFEAILATCPVVEEE